MAGHSRRSNSPTGPPTRDNVRKLQRKLWHAAKRSPDRRFHALHDRISRGDVLEEAWNRVRANRGAAGVDQLTISAVEAYGVEQMLDELAVGLDQGSYRPVPVRRVEIPKPAGGKRPLGIPTVKDRVAQQAAKLVLEPIWEADFLPVSFGFRPRRSATAALETIRKAFAQGYVFAVEADIQDCFGSIDHDRLMVLLSKRVSDRRVLKWVRQWLKAGVMQDGQFRATVAGTPQGGVISPLLANIYLHELDRALMSADLGVVVRYADDFVVMCRDEHAAHRAEGIVRESLHDLGLVPHPDKTRVVDLREGREGFDFLGCHLHARVSGKLLEQGVRRYYLHRWPSTRAMKQVRSKIKALTGRNRSGVKDIRVVIADLNPILRGWGNYFRTGNAAVKFRQIDSYVWRRLVGLMIKRHGRNLAAGRASEWTQDWLRDQGLHRLRGTIRYPEVSLLGVGRPSVSRVRENRTHGLKGGGWDQAR